MDKLNCIRILFCRSAPLKYDKTFQLALVCFSQENGFDPITPLHATDRPEYAGFTKRGQSIVFYFLFKGTLGSKKK